MDKILVGRGGSCDIRLPHPAVSYLHAVIEMSDASVTLTDSDSRNGTLLNGKKLVRGKRTHLRSGDVIGICGFSVKVTLSVPLAEAYSAERSDVLEREMFLAGKPSGPPPGCRLEIVAGEDAGAAFDLPASGTATVGTARGCDFTFSEKKARELKVALVLTPAGWKIEEATAADAAVPVTMPARGRLHDGDEITVGKTKIVFRDAVDGMLAGLRARREADAQPDEDGPRPSAAGAAAKPAAEASPKPASPDRPRAAGEGGPGERYAAEYRIAAVAFGIIVFILSLILLIVLFF